MDAIDKVNIRLKKILEYISLLRKYRGLTKDDLVKNPEKSAAIERFFQLAIEAVIDIANLLNAEYRFRPAEDAKESIEILGKEGVIDKEFADSFSSVAGFRNILVHEYIDIDYNKVAESLNHLDDFERFAREVAGFLK